MEPNSVLPAVPAQMKSFGIIAFTRKGCRLARFLADWLFGQCQAEGARVAVAGPARYAGECGVDDYGTLESWTERHFASDDALVFVGATGIAVRAIAPHVRDKFTDPAVVSVDERGRFAVPLLSGHVGGANDLARAIADFLCGQAVVSTATDVNGLFAVDEWAARHDLAIVERDLAKQISARLLEGKRVGFRTDYEAYCDVPPNAVCAVTNLGFAVSLDDTCRPFRHTLHLVPRVACVGVGCRRGTDPAVLERAVDSALAAAHVSRHAVVAIASIDVKRDEPAIVQIADKRGWEARFYSADALAALPGDFADSPFVERTVGVGNVCERAALMEGGLLALGKQAGDGVTVAVAVQDPDARVNDAWGVPAALRLKRGRQSGALAGRVGYAGLDANDSAAGFGKERERKMAVDGKPATGRLRVVGIGPGGSQDMTARAKAAIEESEVIAGYTVYVDLLKDEFPEKEYLTTPMRKEVDRCRLALEAAASGRSVAMVCSGDPGIYGMAGLVLELAGEYPPVGIEVVPGVSASNGGAAVLGAPLMHDWCTISLSDLLTPWETIEKHLAAAAQADFVISLYNPASHKRADYLKRACDILLRYKDPQTVCGTVRNIGREGQESRVCTLAELRDAKVDMFTCVFVGNSQTMDLDGRMVTPRGYLQRED